MDLQAPSNGRSHSRRRIQSLIDLASAVPIPAIAIVSGVAITGFTLFGILQRTAFPQWDLANLDSELSVATYFSATLLWAVAAGWLLAALAARPRVRSLWTWWAVVAWLALDEGAAIHERVETWSGIDWQVLYIPILAIALMAWWGVVRRYRNQEPAHVALVAGAIVWTAALLLELIQHWGGEPATAVVYNPSMITEEALEMVGSTLFLIAAVAALRVASHR
jgi:hypothetical protein